MTEKSKLPSNWVSTALEDLLEFVIGGDWGKDETFDDPNYAHVLCIRASELRHWDEQKGETAALRKVKKSSLEVRELREGDIILEISGGGPDQPVGRTVLIDRTVLSIKPTYKKICTNFFRLMRPSSRLDSNYLNLFLQFFYKSGKISEYQAGSNNLRNLKFNSYKQIEIPFPPLKEQKRIIAKIEELFSELDNGIAALKKAREQLKVYRQAVLKHAFEGKLTAKWREENYENSWRLEKLGNLIVFLTSGSRGWAKYYSDSGDIFIRAQNLRNDRLDLDDKAFVSLPENAEGKRTQVKQNDILITITGANVTKTGRVATYINNAYVSQHVALCRPSAEIDSEYLYWFLVAESAGRRQLIKFAYGAGKPGLNLDNIRSVEINLPSIPEQLVIVKQINNLLSIEEKVSLDIAAELQRVDLLRQSILKKAFSGELALQDPNDEPASELLARIKEKKYLTKGK